VGDLIFWLVVAIVGAGLVAATLVIKYGKKELPPAETREAIEAPGLVLRIWKEGTIVWAVV